MAGFFTNIGYKETGEWKEEIIFFDADKKPLSPRTAIFPRRRRNPSDSRPRPPRGLRRLADQPQNPGLPEHRQPHLDWLLGRGIVQEPDDIRPDNPPENPELLAYLAQELVGAKYDLKHIYRLILNSRTYQLSSIPRSDSADADKYFAYYPLRRLDAEVLIDALCQVTGTTEKYSSAIPEPYTFIPDDQRPSACPTAASPVPSWNNSDARRATPASNPSATTASRRRNRCTC